MLSFSKGFIKNDKDTKIVSSYNTMNDARKLDDIRKKLHPEIYNKETLEEKKEIVSKETNSIDKVNSMKQINNN